jgi:hypothetical protein
MAAVTAFLEQQDEPSETDAQRAVIEMPPRVAASARSARRIPELQNFGFLELGDLPEFGGESVDALVTESLNKSHAELMRTATVRQAIIESLRGRTVKLQAGNSKGLNRKELFFVLDGPIGREPLWNPPGDGGAEQYRLLSWTSKMGSPSFSLPAGAPSSSGSCPGATAGQTIVPIEKLMAAARSVTARTGQPVRVQQAVCQSCYATGGRYGTGALQAKQVLAMIWTLRTHETDVWFEAMRYAIEYADYLLCGGEMNGNQYRAETPRTRVQGLPDLASWGTSYRFFRVHDSGDLGFGGGTYLRAWKRITEWFSPENHVARVAFLRENHGVSAEEIKKNHGPIVFWAPSRIWATVNGVREVNEINGVGSRNFIIRPSAYHFNERAPDNLGPGWARGSVSYALNQKPGCVSTERNKKTGADDCVKFDSPRRPESDPYDWDCQTYSVVDESHSCRNALAPDGQIGCRACWVHSDLTICYTAH